MSHRESPLLRAALVLAALLGGSAATTASAQDWSPVQRAVEQGIRRRVYPGAVVLVGRRDTVLYARGFGRTSWQRHAPRPDPDATLWDLASVSKVVGTASSIMVLVDQGRIDLDAPVSVYLPRFSGGEKDLVTVRMLLNHTSGLPSYLPLYRLARAREGAIDQLYAQPLVRAPGIRTLYSDLNALLLGLLVEAVAQEPLDSFAAGAVFHPLGMLETYYLPDLPVGAFMAPSRVERGRPLTRMVNDRNAEVFGGIAGHAGLFATGRDLSRFTQGWLREGLPAMGRWVSPETIRRFLERSADGGYRVLGWETPDSLAPKGTPYGRLATPFTFGHTGWTGTLVWFDPSRDLFLVFLTNRSLRPTTRRSLSAMRDLRARVSEAVSRAVTPRCGAVALGVC